MSDLLLSNTAYAEQIELERRSNEMGAQRYYRMVEETEARGEGGGLRASGRFIRHWFEPTVYVVGEIRKAINGDIVSSHGAACRPIFALLTDEKIAVIALKTIMDELMFSSRVGRSFREYGRCTWQILTYSIGRNVYAEANVVRLQKAGKGKDVYDRPLRQLESRMKRLTPAAVNHWARLEFGDSERGQTEMRALGIYLLRRIIDVLSAGDYDNEVFIPALKVVKLSQGHRGRAASRRVKWVYFTDEMRERLDETHAARRTMRPVYLPMVVEPLKLSEERGTGYVTLKQRLVTNTTALHLERLKEAKMPLVYQGLNRLSKTALNIDPFMVRLTDALYDEGGGFPDDGSDKFYIPFRDSTPEPPRPAGYDEDAPHGHKWDAVDPEVRKRWTEEFVPIRARNEWMQHLRQEWLYRRQFMREFSHRDAVWFTYGLDFRGRAYARGVFSHQMSDDVRACMRFARETPLGPNGEYWLRVHCANCYGLDDLSFDDRVAWTVENEHLIREVASDPLRCRWWGSADRKTQMQFIAACRAVAAPEREGLRMPVQLDASANGVQHWSTMSRDRRAAACVNLLPSERPSKFYNIVIDEMKRLMRADGVLSEAEIDALGKTELKQPIMVRDYGGTFSGRLMHFRGVLKSFGWDGVKEKAAYLARLVDPALDAVVPGTSLGMRWVTAAVSQIVEETDKPIEWVTPSGFPIVGRRLRQKRVAIRAMDHDHIIEKPMISDQWDPKPAKSKTVSGAVPDVNHGLDSAHAMLAACAFDEHDADLWTVHDSYGMAAGFVDTGRQLVIDQFVETHREPYLHFLHEWWERHYGVRVLDPPALGDLELSEVRGASYLIR